MRGEDAERADQLGEMRGADRAAQTRGGAARVKESAARRERGIEQAEEAPAAFEFEGEFLQLRTVEPVCPDGADVCAHARSGDAVDLDSVFLQHLDDADMREPFRRAGGKREAHAAAGDFAREPVNEQVEPVVGPGCAAAHRKAAGEGMDGMAEPFQRGVNLGRGDVFLDAQDRLHMAGMAASAVAEGSHEELEIVEILRAGLEQDERDVGLHDACDR